MKRYRILSILMLIILLLNSSIVLAQTVDERYASVKKTGDTSGYIKGRNKATEQFNYTIIRPSEEVRPSKEDLIKEYSLKSKGDSLYELYFIEGFYEGFDRGYYEVIGYKLGITIEEAEITYADALGLLYGEIQAGIDYYNGSRSNWVKAVPVDKTIIELFGLNLQTSTYRSNFLKMFKEKFKEGYETGYENSSLEPKSNSLDSGISDGEEIGSNLGMINGSKDFYGRKTNNFSRTLPTDGKILSDYSLIRDSQLYREGFLIGFKKGYEESYNESYRAANLNLSLLNDSDGFDNGYEIGSIRGEILAAKHYTLNRTSNWRINGITDIMIVREYNLILQTDNYRQGFISGFWQGFAEAYISVYKDLGQEESMVKSTIEEVAISGGTVYSGDNGFAVQIDSGSYYNKVILSIEGLLDSAYNLEDKYTKASNYYKVEITNSTNNYNDATPIHLSFEYYGNNNGGIYKLINNKWIYLSSTIENGKISTKIKPSSLNTKSGIYVVLIDNKTEILADIRAHWARESINAYIRRGFISGYTDKTFKPDRNISRAEFLTILSRVHDWKLPNDIENIKFFKDFAKFGSYSRVISYGYSNGIIKGYGDNTLRPSDYISYKEVEIIMRRVLKSNSFTWQDTANKMLYEKKTRSKYNDSKDNKITRAEFVYMLYLLDE